MSRRVRDAILGYCLVLPSMVLFGVFVFFPFLKNFQLPFYVKRGGGASIGFTNADSGTKNVYVGWKQWRDVLTSDVFQHTLWVTVKFALITVPTGIALGLLLATVAHQRLRGITIYRTIFSSTVATSAAVASTVFVSLFGTFGLRPLKVGGIPILSHPTWSLWAVAAVVIWQSLGLSFIVMSAGLQGIPDDLLEAAEVDGAGPVRRFLRVTLPMISPTIFFATVVGTITAFKTFAEVDLLTPSGNADVGGPTRTIVFEIYDATNGSSPNQGKAAALAVALFAILLVLTMLQLRLGERRVSYDR